MTTRTLIAAGVGGLLMLGCTGMELQAAPPATCNTHECNIDVSVIGDCGNADNIVVDPPTLTVPRANQQAILHWNLVTSGFKFADVDIGITFTTNPLPPPNEFRHPGLANQGKKYHLTDANTAPQTYKYNVQLLRDNGTSCQRKDPQIHNG